MKLQPHHIFPYAAYGLKAEILDYECDYVGKQFDTIVGFHQWDKSGKLWCAITQSGAKPSLERIKPMLRPLDLTKPITVDGIEIVPIVELAMIAFPNWNWPELYETRVCECWVEFEFPRCPEYLFGFDVNQHFYAKQGSREFPYSFGQLPLFQWLYKHHFDLEKLIEQGLAVELT